MYCTYSKILHIPAHLCVTVVTVCEFGPPQPNGMEKNLGLGELSEFEKTKLTEVVVPELKASIKKAEEFCETEITKSSGKTD